MKKSISQNEKSQIFALYTMATRHYAKAREYERDIAQMLGDSDEYNDQVNEAIYSNDPGNPGTLDSILENIGISVRPVRGHRKKAAK